MNVVIIDNDMEQLDLMTATLHCACPGGSVSAFKDPMLAVKHVYNNDTDLVFAEVRMAPVNGFDVLNCLRRIKPNLRIILMSEDGAPQSRASQLHASGFYLKPVSLESVKEALSEIV